MTIKALVLGSGMVGATMARDLAGDENFVVSVADLSPDNLRRLPTQDNLRAIEADLSDAAVLRRLLEDADVVLGAMPSRLGFQTLRTVIESGRPFSDICFMPEDALELDDLARNKGVTAVVDCGVAPGLSNMIVGHAAGRMSRATRAAIYVGGLPRERHWPYQYKAPFAPSDVIEEYTRPARMIERGKVVVKVPLTEPELMDFPGVGTLEAFNTDGLRSLLTTMDIPEMTEKTLRYPGHAELMRVLRHTGFFDQEEIEIRGVRVRPLDVTSRLLFPRWTYEPGEEEFTVMRVIVEGEQEGIPRRFTYDLFDAYDRRTGTSSMARTTAFPATIVARMLAGNEITEKGVLSPERLVRQAGVFERVLSSLSDRGVVLAESITDLSASSPTDGEAP